MPFKCIEPEKLYEKDTLLKRDDVKILRQWLTKQPHLPAIGETQLLLFLHSCYYSIETAKTTIDAYFTRITLYPEIFRILSEEIVRKAQSVVFKRILPKKTPQGYIIINTKLADIKPENYNFIEQTITIGMILTLYLHQHGFADGVVGLFDFKGASLGHLTRVNLSVLKHVFEHIQEGMPIRIKGTHIINPVPFMDTIMGLLKPLISSKLYNMIQIHSSLDTLYKYIPKECLPEDYGGDLPSWQILQEEDLANLFENFDFFKWHMKQKVDEVRRIEKSNIVNPAFGLDGTFKKLELD